jgi:hypothetical protein
MITAPRITPELEAEQLYRRALDRMQRELGWSMGEAHAALAELAAGNGVFLHDVALAVLEARTLKRGLQSAVRQTVFDRRPLGMR